MIEFRMPSLGADMDAGTLVEWYRKPGDALKRGDIISLVETQKGAIEIEVFDEGTLAEIKAAPGDKVPVGEVIALIAGPGEAAGARVKPTMGAPPVVKAKPPPVAPEPVRPKRKPAIAKPEPAAKRGRPTERGTVKASPVARRRATELGIDLTDVVPGPDGVIGLEQLPAARLEAPPAAPPHEPAPIPPRPGLDLAEMRKAIAAVMARSHREIPHYRVGHTIDATPLLAWLEIENARRPVAERLLYVVPLMKALALALKQTPELNGQYADGAFTSSEAVHMGIATALRGGGLVAPAIRDVDSRGLDEIRVALGDLVPRARAGRLRSSEMTGGTVTLSNLGEGSADTVLPLIYPPQVAIIGCGAAVQRPWAVGDAMAIRRVMTLTVAGDHRVSDGRQASRLLIRLAELLERPELL